ncbi:MAG: glycoside hydrolase family 19 protein [Lentibacter algarum]
MTLAMQKLQERIGAATDGSFGPNTARAITKHFGLSAERSAHLLGQASHESGGFKRVCESLYYSSADRIRKVWPSRFRTVEDAQPYARNPKALADKVYSNRMGNGENEGSVFIGRGFLQLTGKENYRSFAADMRLPEVMTDPSLIETDYAFETAYWFFEKNKLFKIADEGVDKDTIEKITKRVNGGYHGLQDRMDQTHKIYNWLT